MPYVAEYRCGHCEKNTFITDVEDIKYLMKMEKEKPEKPLGIVNFRLFCPDCFVGVGGRVVVIPKNYGC